MERLLKTQSLLSIIGAAGLLTWWFLMPVFLPVAEAPGNFENLILDNNWEALNLLGLISAILLTLGFPAFYLGYSEKFNKPGLFGMNLAMVGLILFSGIQYYETVLWPAAALADPQLVGADGALVSGDTVVMAGLIISGAFLGIGYIIFGISALQTHACPKIPVWFLIIGTPVFGNGILFPVRTVGLLLLCAGTIWLAVSIRKRRI